MENRLVKQLHKSFELLKTRNWDKIFIAVDIHDTVMKSTYSDTLSYEYYSDALDTLKLMSNHKDICLILWTSSNKNNAKAYFDALKEKGINMDYINENPEVADKHYADYTSKFYINLILDDKAGFLPELDWPALKDYMNKI
ncbi:MAG: hypothetical protein ABIP51_11170 [Bacteroidia bacterium]